MQSYRFSVANAIACRLGLLKQSKSEQQDTKDQIQEATLSAMTVFLDIFEIATILNDENSIIRELESKRGGGRLKEVCDGDGVGDGSGMIQQD